MTPAIDLRALRLNRGLSVAAAATEIGVSRTTLDRAEKGEHKPWPTHAFKIATFYGYQVTDIWPVEAGAAA